MLRAACRAGGRAARIFHALKPPSTISRLPVVKLEASEAR
jgi:hypothetical protein